MPAKEFLQHVAVLERESQYAEPVRPSPGGTIFVCEGDPELGHSDRTKRDYWSVDVRRVVEGRIVDTPAIWFLSVAQQILLGKLMHQENLDGLGGVYLCLTGVPHRNRRGTEEWTTYEGLQLERVRPVRDDDSR